MAKGTLCKNCPEDKEIIDKLKSILLEEIKPTDVLNGQPLFKKSEEAQLWGEVFNNTQGYKTINLNGQMLFAANDN